MSPRVLPVLLLVLAASGCGTAASTCDATSCPNGCCDAKDVCRPITPLTCGASGGLCTSCVIGSSCIFGQCTASTSGTGGGSSATGGGTATGGGGGTATGGGGGTATGGGGGTATGGGGGTATGGGGGGTATGGGGGTATGGGGGTSTGGGGGTATGGGGGATIDTVQSVRAGSFPSNVNLQGVVVTAISFARVSTASTLCAGSSSTGVNASFWVADANNPRFGVWVEKFRCDGAIDYFPQVGDVLNISGMVGLESSFQQQDGYRVMVKSGFDFIPSKPTGYVCALTSSPPCEPLILTKVGTRVPLAALTVPSTFGAQGAIRAEPSHLGARVRLPGPISVSNIYPSALHRISAIPNDPRYFGYELSNGVLVNNFRTFEGAVLENGVISHCDVRNVVLDGGTVTFPNGLIGVWDTYTQTTCTDGGVSSTTCFNNAGMIPGTSATYTHVLYPTDCADQTP